MQPLVALPDGLNARLAVPRPGEESAELGETPHHLTEGWRRWRRMAVVLHRIEGMPLSRFKDDLTGHRWIRTASHRDGVDTPRHDHVHGQGMQ